MDLREKNEYVQETQAYLKQKEIVPLFEYLL